MPVTIYGYRDAMSAFFEFPTENAREILPEHLEPVEVHHGTSIFAMTAFDFNESSVGEYGELVMAVIVSPLVKPGERLPKSAMYPYLVATTTKAAREHAIERWHLPHFMADIKLEFDRSNPKQGVARATDLDGGPIAELTVAAHTFGPSITSTSPSWPTTPGSTSRASSWRETRASTRTKRDLSSCTITTSTSPSASRMSTPRPSGSCGCGTGVRPSIR